jgi:hypothetical protein
VRSLLLGRVVQVWQGIAPVEAGRANLPWFHPTVYIATACLSICFRNALLSGVGMDFSGSPSLLAFVALVGFVVVEVLLKFGA